MTSIFIFCSLAYLQFLSIYRFVQLKSKHNEGIGWLRYLDTRRTKKAVWDIKLYDNRKLVDTLAYASLSRQLSVVSDDAKRHLPRRSISCTPPACGLALPRHRDGR